MKDVMSQPGGKETTLLEAVWLLCGRGSASRYLHGWCVGPFYLTEEVLFPVMLFWLALWALEVPPVLAHWPSRAS